MGSCPWTAELYAGPGRRGDVMADLYRRAAGTQAVALSRKFGLLALATEHTVDNIAGFLPSTVTGQLSAAQTGNADDWRRCGTAAPVFFQ